MSEPANGSPFGFTGSGSMKDMLERSQSALEELNSAARHGLEALTLSAQTAQRGAEEVRAQALVWCQRMADDAVEAARDMAQAASPADAMRVQTNYSRRWLESYMAAMREVSQAMGASMQASLMDVVHPFSTRPPHPEGGVES